MKNDHQVNIAFVCDDNYSSRLSVTLFSLAINTSVANNYHIFVFYPSLSSENKRFIRSTVRSWKNIKLIFIKSTINQYSHNRSYLHLNQTVYQRLSIPNLLRNIGKVLYLDCDLLILNDVALVFNTNLNKKTVGAVKLFHPNFSLIFSRLHPTVKSSMLFNSGVMLIDIKRFNKKNYEQKLVAIGDRYSNKLFAADQDLLNIVMNEDVYLLNPKWNVQSYVFFAPNAEKLGIDESQFQECLHRPSIVHFDGTKPWNYRLIHPYHNKYITFQTQLNIGNNYIVNSDTLKYYFFASLSMILKIFPRRLYQSAERIYLSNNFLEKRYKEITNEKY